MRVYMYILYCIIRCWKISGRFCSVVLEKAGDQLHRSYEKWRNVT